MKYTLLFPFLLLAFVTRPLSAQSGNEEMVDLSSDELNSLARKLAELRARRVMMYRQQQAQWQQYYMMQGQANKRGADAGAVPRETREIEREIDQDEYDIVYDTIITIDENFNEDMRVVERRVPRKNVTATNLEMDAIRARLDNQQRLLEEIREQAYLTNNAPSATPRDTVIQRVVATGDPNQLTRDDLRRMSDEMARLNEEIDRLRVQNEYAERRRRNAEERMDDILRNRDRRYDRDRDRDLELQLRLERERQLQRELDRERDRARFNGVPVQPYVASPTNPTVIRDTVIVERTNTDTVRVDNIIREPGTLRILRDTVEKEREVVRTETVQLAAKEPIGFPTIFFANNSSTLDATHRNIISSMIDEMQNKGDYNVRLTGYASPSGNAEYNQQLSARRAEAVKQGLMQMGIPERRIRLIAGGIDYQPSSPAAARRVEIQAIPQ